MASTLSPNFWFLPSLRCKHPSNGDSILEAAIPASCSLSCEKAILAVSQNPSLCNFHFFWDYPLVKNEIFNFLWTRTQPTSEYSYYKIQWSSKFHPLGYLIWRLFHTCECFITSPLLLKIHIRLSKPFLDEDACPLLWQFTKLTVWLCHHKLGISPPA